MKNEKEVGLPWRDDPQASAGLERLLFGIERKRAVRELSSTMAGWSASEQRAGEDQDEE